LNATLRRYTLIILMILTAFLVGLTVKALGQPAPRSAA
jgi:hypothetical protein